MNKLIQSVLLYSKNVGLSSVNFREINFKITAKVNPITLRCQSVGQTL